jgi:pimeloyl-ACP methyl ester carboxylesterase
MRVSEVVFSNSRVRLQVDLINGAFDGPLNAQSKIIEGQWKQGRWSQPLILKKVPAVSAPRRPQTPVPPFPYDEQGVTFLNAEADARLAGTLTQPRTGGPHPAAILIPGGGAHDRDYLILRHRPFLVLADHLTRHGIAALRFDERGVGASTGDRSQATSEDFAGDVLAGWSYLRTLASIDPNRIGLIGHSEGGTIAALAAAQRPDVAFIVMMGSPGLPGKQYNLQFEESTARSLGQSEEAVAARVRFQERVLSVIVEERDPAVTEARLRHLYRELSPSMPPAQIESGLKRLLSPWFRFNVTHDPGATLRTVQCSVLAVIGEKDVQVPPAGNLDAIRQALQAGGNNRHRVEELSGLNHFFQTCATGSPVEYGKIEETMSPAVLSLLSDWILGPSAADR